MPRLVIGTSSKSRRPALYAAITPLAASAVGCDGWRRARRPAPVLPAKPGVLDSLSSGASGTAALTFCSAPIVGTKTTAGRHEPVGRNSTPLSGSRVPPCVYRVEAPNLGFNWDRQEEIG